MSHSERLVWSDPGADPEHDFVIAGRHDRHKPFVTSASSFAHDPDIHARRAHGTHEDVRPCRLGADLRVLRVHLRQVGEIVAYQRFGRVHQCRRIDELSVEARMVALPQPVFDELSDDGRIGEHFGLRFILRRTVADEHGVAGSKRKDVPRFAVAERLDVHLRHRGPLAPVDCGIDAFIRVQAAAHVLGSKQRREPVRLLLAPGQVPEVSRLAAAACAPCRRRRSAVQAEQRNREHLKAKPGCRVRFHGRFAGRAQRLLSCMRSIGAGRRPCTPKSGGS